MNYLLVGSEVYNLQSRRDSILKELGLENEQPDVFFGAVDAEEVVGACLTAPFFTDKKAVIIENPDFIVSGRATDEKTVNRLIEYLEQPLETTTLIVYVDKPFDRRKKGYTALRKYLKTEVFDTVTPDDFRVIVRNDIRNAGLKMTSEAYDMLMERLPLDVLNWKSELEKLALYPGVIDRKAIRALVSRSLEDDVFQLSNAVVARNMGKALQCFRDLMVNNPNDTTGIIGLLAYQFRFMCQVKNLNEQGYTIRDIAERYNAKEYRITMTLKSAQGRSSKALLDILSRLSQLDQDIKRGKKDSIMGLEMFIIDVTGD